MYPFIIICECTITRVCRAGRDVHAAVITLRRWRRRVPRASSSEPWTINNIVILLYIIFFFFNKYRSRPEPDKRQARAGPEEITHVRRIFFPRADSPVSYTLLYAYCVCGARVYSNDTYNNIIHAHTYINTPHMSVLRVLLYGNAASVCASPRVHEDRPWCPRTARDRVVRYVLYYAYNSKTRRRLWDRRVISSLLRSTIATLFVNVQNIRRYNIYHMMMRYVIFSSKELTIKKKCLKKLDFEISRFRCLFRIATPGKVILGEYRREGY